MDPTEPLPEELGSLLERFQAGKRTALARAISVIENERPGFQGFLHRVLAAGPRARRVGVTGPPGAGKSSLIAELANLCRARNEEVGVVHGPVDAVYVEPLTEFGEAHRQRCFRHAVAGEHRVRPHAG